jgi:hypothetical protein
MSSKWRWFLASAVLGGYLLLLAGAPLPGVAAGIGGAALILRRKSHTV